MKKIFILLINLILLTSLAVFSYADDEVDEAIEFDQEEYDTTLSGQKGTKLTQRQMDEGWVIINGRIYPPNDIEGALGDSIRGTNVEDENYGILTIKGNIQDTYDDLYITLVNTETFLEYSYYLHYANNYTTTVKLPPGQYLVFDGGKVNDTKDVYTCSQSGFKIEDTKETTIEVHYTTYEHLTNVQQVYEEKHTEEEIKEKKHNFALIFVGLSFVGLSAAIIISYKKIKDRFQ